MRKKWHRKTWAVTVELLKGPATKKDTAIKKSSAVRAAAKPEQAASKISRVIEMLKRKDGVTLTELMTEMGWQAHTTRSLMSAGGSLAKKYGLTIISGKSGNGERTYSIQSA